MLLNHGEEVYIVYFSVYFLLMRGIMDSFLLTCYRLAIDLSLHYVRDPLLQRVIAK